MFHIYIQNTHTAPGNDPGSKPTRDIYEMRHTAVVYTHVNTHIPRRGILLTSHGTRETTIQTLPSHNSNLPQTQYPQRLMGNDRGQELLVLYICTSHDFGMFIINNTTVLRCNDLVDECNGGHDGNQPDHMEVILPRWKPARVNM